MFDIEDLMFLKASKKDENLLDYSDLANMTYGGDPSEKNVLTMHKITVTPGASMLLTGPSVTELMIRFYDENNVYLSDKTITRWAPGTDNVSFTVPDNAAAIWPKWNNTAGLLVADFVATNPIIKYA